MGRDASRVTARTQCGPCQGTGQRTDRSMCRMSAEKSEASFGRPERAGLSRFGKRLGVHHSDLLPMPGEETMRACGYDGVGGVGGPMARIIDAGIGARTPGEQRALDVLRTLPKSWLIIANKMLPLGRDQSLEIDMIVVGEHRIFVID